MRNPKGGLTIKQEKFARAYVETGNASEALKQVYFIKPDTKPASINRIAYKLIHSVKIKSRVNEILALNARKHEVSVGSVTKELEEARIIAVTEKLPSAAVSASMAKAKLHGLIIDKSYNENVEVNPKEPVSMYELAKTIAFMLSAGAEQAQEMRAELEKKRQEDSMVVVSENTGKTLLHNEE